MGLIVTLYEWKVLLQTNKLRVKKIPKKIYFWIDILQLATATCQNVQKIMFVREKVLIFAMMHEYRRSSYI